MGDSIAIVFPGQGSQSAGMLSELASGHAVVEQTFAEASDVLGIDLWALSQQGPADELNRTELTQPAMLAAGVAVWRAWREQGGREPAALAGHSLGEYTALVCAESIAFRDAVRLVNERGRFMQEAVPAGEGAMAALLGLDDEAVARVCAEAAKGDVVEAVNFNAPGQVVIAGAAAAVDRAVELAKDAGARRAVMLPVSVPSHCALMKPASERLAGSLSSVTIREPVITVLHNVDARPARDASAIRDALIRQLHSPVRWVETVQSLAASGTATLVECGPGKVLAGLTKRIDKSLNALPVYDPSTLDRAVAELSQG